MKAIRLQTTILVLGILLTSCGGDQFRATPLVPPGSGYGYQAPVPPGGFQPPQQPPPPGQNVFRPQMPPQMPPQMYPFLPVYQMMQQNQQLAYQWQVLWQQWLQYANYYQQSQYDFAVFWTDFCPQQQQFQQVYGYLDYNFYYWVDQDTYFPPQVDVSYYWGGYDYYPMSCDYCY